MGSGTLDVCDDYPNWVAQEMGYWKELGIDSQMNAGPLDATAGPKAVAAGTMDMSYPSPGVFSLVLAAGLPVKSVWEMGAYDVFDFAMRMDSPYKNMKDLAGKTILLGSAGWQSIADPEFAQVGIDTKSLHYEAAGQQWGQALKAGQGDAALSWEGLRAQWDGTGLKFRYILGQRFSQFPANSFVVRSSDLSSSKWQDIYTRYLRGWAMGLEFGHINPAAATQIVYKYRRRWRTRSSPPLARNRRCSWPTCSGATGRTARGSAGSSAPGAGTTCTAGTPSSPPRIRSAS